MTINYATAIRMKVQGTSDILDDNSGMSENEQWSALFAADSKDVPTTDTMLCTSNPYGYC